MKFKPRIRAKKGTTVCSTCKTNERRPGQRTCTECHAAYQRENRKPYSELTDEQRMKIKARAYANVYKQRGLLIQQPCKCGNTNSQMHHEDYNKPLEVDWLCRECHLEHHQQAA